MLAQRIAGRRGIGGSKQRGRTEMAAGGMTKIRE
jgi:hypothetical protein